MWYTSGLFRDDVLIGDCFDCKLLCPLCSSREFELSCEFWFKLFAVDRRFGGILLERILIAKFSYDELSPMIKRFVEFQKIYTNSEKEARVTRPKKFTADEHRVISLRLHCVHNDCRFTWDDEVQSRLEFPTLLKMEAFWVPSTEHLEKLKTFVQFRQWWKYFDTRTQWILTNWPLSLFMAITSLTNAMGRAVEVYKIQWKLSFQNFSRTLSEVSSGNCMDADWCREKIIVHA